MRFWLFILMPLALGAASPSPAPSPVAASEGAPLDYATMSHSIGIDSLRAGNHDESGTNDYYFTLSVFALLNSSEERNAPFESRKKIVQDGGTFGDTQIAALDVWKPDEKLKVYKETKVDGNTIRELMARAMNEFKVTEGDLCIMAEITLFERNKRFFFLGEDTLVAKTSYYPIPPTKFDTPLRTNQALAITDDKGTLVKLSVKY